VVRALERQELVERQRDPGDARSVRVMVTAAGRERLQGALADVETADAEFFAEVADEALVPRLQTLAGRGAATAIRAPAPPSPGTW
ncbi:MAG TPA: winged helix DNA-binding protein, partial [Gaiellales bacterium]|nr:winged helix DNA-binding protein [Gaiellales bacterium]